MGSTTESRSRQLISSSIAVGDTFPEVQLVTFAEGRPMSLGGEFAERTLIFVWASW